MEKTRKGETSIPYGYTCPISLEVMLDPVTLSTGHSFERHNIERWFWEGNLTCPMTLAKLEDPSFVPNHTLRKMIQQWFTKNWLELFAAGIVFTESDIPTSIQVNLLVRAISARDEVQEVSPIMVRRLRSIAKMSEADSMSIVKAGAVPHLVAILLDTSKEANELFVYALGALALLPLSAAQKRQNLSAFAKFLPRIFDLLMSGSVGKELYAAEMLASMAEIVELRSSIGQAPGVMGRLLTIISNGRPYKLSAASIRTLLQLCYSPKVRTEAANAGAVEILVESLPTFKKELTEKSLAILELLCSTAEGRACMIEHPLAVPTLVRSMTRVSEWGAGYSTSALWAVCKADPEIGGVAAIQAGALPQLLLVIQSDCALCTKHKAVELLKLLRHLWEDYHFPSQYDASSTIL